MTGFFVFVPLVWGVLYTMSWLLAGDLLDGLPARQLAESYGLIGGAAIVGGLLGGALVLQVLVLPRLHKWIGVGGGLLVLPVVLSGGVGALVAGVTVLGISSLRVAEGGLKSSLHRPNWEQAYLLMSGPERSVTKLLIDGFGVRLAEGVAASMLYVWLLRYGTVAEAVAGGANRVLILLFFCSLVWLVLTWLLRRRIRLRRRGGWDFDRVRYDIPLPDG